jgi:hypothetical protein
MDGAETQRFSDRGPPGGGSWDRVRAEGRAAVRYDFLATGDARMTGSARTSRYPAPA